MYASCAVTMLRRSLLIWLTIARPLVFENFGIAIAAIILLARGAQAHDGTVQVDVLGPFVDLSG